MWARICNGCALFLSYNLININMQNSKIIFFFNVLTYTDDYSYIVKSKKEVKVIRAHFSSAYRYILTKYPMNKGFNVELLNSCKISTYIKDRKNWREYLAK